MLKWDHWYSNPFTDDLYKFAFKHYRNQKTSSHSVSCPLHCCTASKCFSNHLEHSSNWDETVGTLSHSRFPQFYLQIFNQLYNCHHQKCRIRIILIDTKNFCSRYYSSKIVDIEGDNLKEMSVYKDHNKQIIACYIKYLIN